MIWLHEKMIYIRVEIEAWGWIFQTVNKNIICLIFQVHSKEAVS